MQSQPFAQHAHLEVGTDAVRFGTLGEGSPREVHGPGKGRVRLDRRRHQGSRSAATPRSTWATFVAKALSGK